MAAMTFRRPAARMFPGVIGRAQNRYEISIRAFVAVGTSTPIRRNTPISHRASRPTDEHAMVRVGLPNEKGAGFEIVVHPLATVRTPVISRKGVNAAYGVGSPAVCACMSGETARN